MGRIWKDLVLAACFAAVGAFVLPLQTYLANADLYDFSIGRAVLELAVAFVAIGSVAFLLLRFPGRRLGGCLHALFAALTVCIYLESGILSAGLPEINGGPVPQLDGTGRCVFDACVWVCVFAVLLATVRWTRPFLHWIAAAALLLSAASLLDVRRADDAGVAPQDAGYVNQMTVVENVKYSPTNNVLVFILDSMPGRSAFELWARHPEILKKLPGFTGYPRNVGMHEVTKRGVAGLVTGRYFDPGEIPESDYPMTTYGRDSFVMQARDLGWNVACSPDLFPYGYTNLPIERRVERGEERRSGDAIALLRLSRGAPFISLLDTVCFRYAPFFFKAPILYSSIRHSVALGHASDGFWGERFQFGHLANCPTNADARPFLGVFHTWGAHPPWKDGQAPPVICGLGTRLGELMDAYRARGLYDQSLIIVTADHGLGHGKYDLLVDGYPLAASAFLMVKPAGATAPFAVSDLRTSHSRIAPLVRKALTEPVDARTCGEILGAAGPNPLFRAVVHEGGRKSFRDWTGRSARTPGRGGSSRD